MASETLARWRVPLGWLLGLSALYVAKPRPEWLIAGLGVALPGEALRVWAAGYLHKNKELTTEGPYAWTRNPLYLGSLVVGLGFCLATGRLFLLLLLAGLFTVVYGPVMKREAERLGLAHPAEYPKYAARVPLFLPRLPRAEERPPARSGFSWARVRRNGEHLTMMGLVLAVALLWAKWLFWG